MNLSFWFARKYFYSKKVRNVINIISRISQIGITVCATALIIVLSVFNGLEDLMISLYNSFDSDIKITLEEGKYFEPDSSSIAKLKFINGFESYSEVVEEKVLLEYKSEQYIATAKGISQEYLESINLDSMIIYGEPLLKFDEINYAILGVGVASKLDIGYFDYSNLIHIYFPRKSSGSFYLNPQSAFQRKNIIPSGVFSIQEEFDSKYILVPVDFLQEVAESIGKVTAIEANFKEGTNLKKVKSEICEIFNDNFDVKNRDEQHASLYKITRLEKYMTFLILSFILLIAAFNLVGSLLMLSLEKKKDMMVLKTMGAKAKFIKYIFFYEGILLSISSAIIGVLLGILLVWLQMTYGFIKLGGAGSTFIVDSYPVGLKGMDVLLVFLVVVVIGFISSYLPARSANKDISIKDLHK